MSYGNYIVLLLAATATVALCKPQSGLDLSLVISETLCPTVVKYDVNETRIPRVIKTLACEEDPDQVCLTRRKPEECCRRLYPDNAVSKCVEVMDTVQVSSADLSQQYSIRVPVGCTCIVLDATAAEEIN